MLKQVVILSIVFFDFLHGSTQTNPSILSDDANIKAILIKDVDALNKTQIIDNYMSCFAPTEDIIFGPNKNQLIKGATALKRFAEKIIVSYQKNPNKNSWSFSD